mgnify:CR=1 FL=1
MLPISQILKCPLKSLSRYWLLNIVSSLSDSLSLFSFLQRGISVVPVIGIMQDRCAFKPDANTAEVEEIFDAPLEMFLKVLFSCLSAFSP